MVGSGRRPLPHLLGFRRPGPDDHRGLGRLFDRDFHIPGIGRWPAVGFVEDLFAVGVLVGIVTFAILRIRQAPARQQREVAVLRLAHPAPAWVILGMIAAVVVTLLIYRGAQINTGVFPFGDSPWAFASWTVAKILPPLGQGANEVLETVFLLANVAVILAFLVIVTYSKHLHIALAPLNVGAKRVPDGLGPLLPVTDTAGKPIDFADAENSTRTRSSAAARSRTSPGRACWTSRPAPSAAAASRSARPGTPASRCRPSS